MFTEFELEEEKMIWEAVKDMKVTNPVTPAYTITLRRGKDFLKVTTIEPKKEKKNESESCCS